MSVGLRWATVAGLFLMVGGLAGCRVMSVAEYERMREHEELAQYFKNQAEGLNKDVDRAVAERQRAQQDLASLQTELQAARSDLTAAERRLEEERGLAARAVEAAQVLSRQLDDLRQRNKELADRLAMPGVDVGPGVETIYGPEGYGYRIPGALLFAPGMAELREEAKETLDKIVAQLKQTDEKIRVCGYTDSDPIVHTAHLWDSNFQLSAARALAVLNYLASQGIPKQRMHFAGFGEYALIYDESGQEDKARSRRAEIWLLTADPTVEGATVN